MNHQLNETLPVKLNAILTPNRLEWTSAYFQILWVQGAEGSADEPSIALIRPDLRVTIPAMCPAITCIAFHADFLTRKKMIMNAAAPLVMPVREYSKTLLSQILYLDKNAPKNRWKSRIACAVFSLIIEFLEHFAEHRQQSKSDVFAKPKAVSPIDAKAIIYAARYIRTHMANPDLSLDELAKAIGYNPNYFCQEFGRILSVSPIRFLNNLRLDRALGLLEHSDLAVQTICTMVGIRNPSRLSSMVKEREGQTPLEFRRTKRIQNSEL